MKYEVEIPLPPSTNHLYSNASKGRLKTRPYKAWLSEVTWLLRSSLPALVVPVKLGVTIYGGKGFSIQSDISNRIKAVEDALVKAGRIPDDNVKYVTEVRSRYFVPQGTEKARCVLGIVDGREEE